MRRELALGAALLLGTVAAPAQTPTCDALMEGRRALAQHLLASEYMYECCDDTIDACLRRDAVPPLAVRLAENLCRRVAAGQDEPRIRRSLSRRGRSMMGGGSTAAVMADAAMTAGVNGAPVTVVVYACARCPFCSRLVPELHRAVTEGQLAGQARLVFRTFPIRGHERSTEAGLAFVAAASLGRFWAFALHAYGHFDEFSVPVQERWATDVGLDGATFAARVDDPATREALVASKKEGLVNGVEETPTVFIDGRRWVGDLEAAELVDAVEEEAARVRGELCVAR